MISVLAAFFDSGGLNAGTPFAIASTPVRATEPPAKALSSRKIVRVCDSAGIAYCGAGNWWAVPVTTCMTPTAIADSAMNTNR